MQMDIKYENKFPDRDDIHLRALEKLADEIAGLLRFMTSHLNLSWYKKWLI